MYNDEAFNNWVNLRPIGGFGGNIPVPYSGSNFFEYNGCLEWWRGDTASIIKKAKEKCPPVSSVIGKKANCLVAGNLEVLNATSNNYVRGKYKEWETLFAQPNFLQSYSQFMKQLYSYINTYGYAYVLKDVIPGFAVPDAMWILPNEYLRFELNVTKPFHRMTAKDTVRKVFFNYNGYEEELDPKYLMLFTDGGSSALNETTLLPQSRFVDLQYPVSNLIGCFESRATLIQSRGAIGVLSNSSVDSVGTMPIPQEEKQRIQNQYRGNYGLSRDKWQVIFTEASLNWTPMVFNVDELGLHPEYISCYKDICENYNYPFMLTGFAEKTTYNNVITASQDLYQNTIIPESKDLMQQFMRNLEADKNNIVFQIDYSEISALQQSEKEKGDGRKSMDDALMTEWDNGLITRNQWLEALGLDTVNRTEFNSYKWELSQEQQNFVMSNQNSNIGNESTPTTSSTTTD